MTTLDDFSLFPFLPPELRLEIWRFASLKAASDMAVCAPSIGLVVSEVGNPALFFTNREARQVAMQCSISRPYNPATDITYSPRLESWHVGQGNIGPDGWEENVCHIAIHLSKFRMPVLAKMLRYLSSLRTISIVHPAPSDKPIINNRWQRARLRLLEALEEDDTDRNHMLQLREYYMAVPKKGRLESDDPASPIDRRFLEMDGGDWGHRARSVLIFRRIAEDLEARREKSIRDQLMYLEFMLNKEVLLGYPYPIGSWDNAKGRLRLRYDARCFGF
ncbi:hypothetical protein QBC34DRAFT_456795 [Podospora aff. communis PSN243]|uniref:2EXR domain-containing protein n=1 Tax=Podospora aff. communis PSN243 TaxID=3040156 RepID=A0AAV9FWQ6_9PEZI|nr:hypothetical protein QBC34DRAFT_456795 [Podospora aff. communis PSN243]